MLVSLVTYWFICLYILGFVWLLLSLSKKYYISQIALFARTYVAIVIILLPTYHINKNIFEGLIWFIVPFSMIMINDEMTYMFNTLIKSPKKTWGGFIFGGISTIIFGLLIANILCQYPYLVCPIESSDALLGTNIDCVPSSLFQSQEYTLPSSLQLNGKSTLTLYPFVLLSLLLSILSSIIGPFGEYFAGGFKRKFHIKNFGNTIPGYGGIMDVFVSHYLMATFVSFFCIPLIKIIQLIVEDVTIKSATEGV